MRPVDLTTLLGVLVLGACGDTQAPSARPLLEDLGVVTIEPRESPAAPGAQAEASSSNDAPEPSEDGGIGGAAGGNAGGSGGISAGGSRPMTERAYCDAVALVFIPRCGGGSCHNRPNATIADFAVGQEEAASFVDVPSVRNATCGLIINSSDPAESLIYRKLVGDFEAPKCGGFMPVSGGDLTDEQIDCVADWVEQFAR